MTQANEQHAATTLGSLRAFDPSEIAALGGFAYLATPYSKYPEGIEPAWEDACAVAASLIRGGLNIYCPIAHTHPIAVRGRIDPLDHGVWLRVDGPLMLAATSLIVAKLPGWADSVGVVHEIGEFRGSGKPVFGLDMPVQWPSQ